MSINFTQSNYQRIHSQPAYILHTTPYQNTSLLVDAFTLNYGRIRFIAKGAKRVKSTFAGKLQAFSALLLSWSGRGELYTLTDVEFIDVQQYALGNNNLRGNALLSAYYINELLLRFVILEDPHDELFYFYADTIEKLQTKKNVESVLRRFEKNLLNEVGYSLLLSKESESGIPINAEQLYYYVFSEGPRQASSRMEKYHVDGIFVSGQTLLDLERDTFTSNESLKQAKQLMRAIIASHLGGVSLKTRTQFQSTIL